MENFNLPSIKYLQRELDNSESRREAILRQFRADVASGIGAGTADQVDDNIYPQYEGRIVEFVKEILGIQLTADQEKVLRAVEQYEIVQIASATGVGKTFVMAVLAIAIYKIYGESKTFTAAAPPEDNLRDLLWAEIFTITNSHQHLFDTDHIQKGDLKITRYKKPKQFLNGVTIPQSSKEEMIETRFSGKHAPVLFFIFDEGDGIPDAVYRGADGCMSGGFVRQVVCFNPKKKAGEPYRRIKEQRCYTLTMSAFTHPNVTTGEDVVPGAVTREKTVSRINEWTEPLRKSEKEDSNCFKVPDFLVGVRAKNAKNELYPPLPAGYRRVIDQQFWYKVLGQYPRAGTSIMFHEEWIDWAIFAWERFVNEHGRGPDTRARPPRGVRPVMGLDPSGEGGYDAACIVFRYGGFISEPHYFKTDPDAIAMIAAKMYVEYDCKAAYIDAHGLGEGVPKGMEREARKLEEEFGKRININAIPVKGNTSTNGFSDLGDFENLRTECAFMLRDAFKNKQIMIPGDARLRESLEILKYYHKPNKKNTIYVMRKPIILKELGYSPDYLSAILMTYAPSNIHMGGLKG